jgi:hypothetical protein
MKELQDEPCFVKLASSMGSINLYKVLKSKEKEEIKSLFHSDIHKETSTVSQVFRNYISCTCVTNRESVIFHAALYIYLQVILAIGGKSSGTVLSSVECFTFGYDSWKCIVPRIVHDSGLCEETRVIPTMHYARLYAAVTATEYEVFVIGMCTRLTLVSLLMHMYIRIT